MTDWRPVRRDWLEALGVGVALFALYAATAPRTVATEDDGLFVLSSYFLGVEHPPGYPLYTLLGKLFTLLPVGSVAYRVHLLSGLLGGASCAALWLCARQLIDGRLPAYVAALGLGLSVTFWSQALIAEVYTFNTLFFIVLLWMALRASARTLPWMALLFGLSLANHYPLMLLVAPAFAILLWPLRGEMLRRLPLLAVVLLLAAALPYAWLVLLSRSGAPISFFGPLEHWAEIWYFVSREGYGEVDSSPTAGWLDRLKFFGFQATELLVQFAVVGTALAALGCWAQWRVLGKRVSWALTVAFLMPTFVLLLLLGFDYNFQTKHVFRVYPLPAYAVVALWMGLGFAWLASHQRLVAAHQFAAAVLVGCAIAAVGSRSNLLADYDWSARYAQAVLRTLPKNALLFVRGDADLAPIAYFHMIEGQRPDITLYQSKGLVLGNRLFHPLRTPESVAQEKIRELIDGTGDPVAFTWEFLSGRTQRDRWLFVEVDRAGPQSSVDIPEEAVQFFEQSLMDWKESNDWIAFTQGELRRRYAILLARALPRDGAPEPRVARQFAALSADPLGVLGLAEGTMARPGGYSAAVVTAYLDKARELLPSDALGQQRARYFHLRGALRLDLGDRRGATQDFETALALWPSPNNSALAALEDLYRGDEQALRAARALVRGPRR